MNNQASMRSVRDIPALQAQRLADRPAVTVGGETFSYAELGARAGRACANLGALGLKAGQRTAWLGMNSIQWFDTGFGAALADGCFLPINYRLSVTEIAYILDHSQAPLLVVSEDLLALAQEACAQVAAPPQIVTAGFDRPGHPRIDRGELRPAALPEGPGGDILQLYTSGTTGRPKGACLSDANYAAFLVASRQIPGFDYDAADTVLIAVPIFHVAGFNVVMASLAAGSHVIVHREFEAGEVMATIARDGVTRTFLVPAMINALLHSGSTADVSSMRSIGYGASPISEAVLTGAQARFGCDFVQYYGMTESAGGGSYLAPQDHHGALLRSCGKPWAGLEMAILGPDGLPLPDGMVGEIAIRGAMLTTGYWRNPEATADAIRNGWLHTGDAGIRDAAGFYFVQDRVKDMIVSGGENIYPAEVENALAGCPGVVEVAVIGIPSERWGEEVKAIVVTGPEAPSAQAVIDWARDRIAAYKLPKTVEFIPALPRNASGKVLKRELRAPYWEGRDRSVS
ncbi:AMP-binding protein [Novosphingobium sp.]|uniref:AMP-binding protein n=1 Tax=Novosphingobium sp. TaxID=1874826 RepID=UPI0027326355|nr:AMP-binding protein [Novosphingobium sp.]MDP3908581.1 AMP-binding protein [Novosphingobium sp.]